MEFRNHQNWILHHYRNAARGPVSTALIALLALLAVVPVLLLGMIVAVVFALVFVARALLGGGFGRAAAGPPRPAGPAKGPVIDVEVLRRGDR